MKHSILTLFLALAGLLNLSAQAYVTLYEDCGYGGRSSTLSAGDYDLDRMGVANDQLSAMKIPNGFTVTLYADSRFRGASQTFTSDQYCLTGNWNNNASSIRITGGASSQPNNSNYSYAAKKQGYEQQQQHSTYPHVTIFSECNMVGNKAELGPGYHDVNGLGINNDDLSSIAIPEGWSVQAYKDGGYRGANTVITHSQNCLDGEWNNQISSLVIHQGAQNYPMGTNYYHETNTATPASKYQKPTNYSQDHVTIFADCNFNGASKNLVPGRYDVYDLGIGNDVLSSFHVPQGLQIVVYEDGGFRGRFEGFRSDMSCLPAIWNDRVSSIVVSRY